MVPLITKEYLLNTCISVVSHFDKNQVLQIVTGNIRMSS